MITWLTEHGPSLVAVHTARMGDYTTTDVPPIDGGKGRT